MIDVAEELGLHSYLFSTCSAAFLGFMLYLPIRHSQIGREFNPSDPDSVIPSFENPVPEAAWPLVFLNKDGGYETLLNLARRFTETRAIIVNTSAELEPYAVNSLTSSSGSVRGDEPLLPPAYAVGPVVELKVRRELGVEEEGEEIIKWLDEQPQSSVVFLCFGSVGIGTFETTQLVEIATALERRGHRFLWTTKQALPEGFLEKTEGRGKVCKWAPQVEVLGHRATGAFVSHCGWNSILESLWFGVPVVTWPMYGEQQLNAFQLIKELGLAVELRLDYKIGGRNEVVTAEEIEKAIRTALDRRSPVRKRVIEMMESSRRSVVEGGSSYGAVGSFLKSLSLTSNA